MDKIKIAEKIKEAVSLLPAEDGKRMTLEKFNAWLEANNHGLKFDKSLFSRIIKGSDGVADRHYEDLCRVLGIEYTDGARPLKVGFSQGFWAAPLLVHNHVETSANRDLFSQVQFSAYSRNGTPCFNPLREKIDNFAKGENSVSEPGNPDNDFYFSGEITGLLRKRSDGEYPIDIGFCGSTIIEDNDTFIRVARLADARAARHAGVLIAPKGIFQKTDKLDKSQVLRYLLEIETTGKPICHILYQLGSTSEKECQLLFQKTWHKRETIQILNVNRYKEEFKKRLLDKPNDVWVQIALMLTTNAAESVVREIDPKDEKFELLSFRTADFADKDIMGEDRVLKLDDKGFYYEMVMLRDRVHEIVQHLGFMMLFDYLKNAVADLNQTKTQEGDSHDAFNRVATFWGLPLAEVNKRLRQTEFSLLFYPEFTKQLLELMQK